MLLENLWQNTPHRTRHRLTCACTCVYADRLHSSCCCSSSFSCCSCGAAVAAGPRHETSVRDWRQALPASGTAWVVRRVLRTSCVYGVVAERRFTFANTWFPLVQPAPRRALAQDRAGQRPSHTCSPCVCQHRLCHCHNVCRGAALLLPHHLYSLRFPYSP